MIRPPSRRRKLLVFEAWTGGRQLESFLQRDVRGRLVRTSRTKGGDHASEKIRAAYRVLSSFKIGSDVICAKTSSKLGLGQIMSCSYPIISMGMPLRNIFVAIFLM